MEIKMVPVHMLKNYANNARLHSDEQIVQIIDSIKNYGFLDPIEIGADNVIISGHARLQAAIRAGLTEVPVVTHSHLDESARKAYILAANRIAQSATWDEKLVGEELQALLAEDFDISLTGFTQDEIDSFLNPDVTIKGLSDPDDVPAASTTAVSQRGDVWLLGDHRLMCGDSTVVTDVEKLMNGEKATMIFTDPPYGLNYSGGRTQVVKHKPYGKLKNDDLNGIDLGNLIANIFTVGADEIYICVSPKIQKPFLDFIEKANKKIDAIIVWNKGQAGLGYMKYRRQCEFIIYIRETDFKKTDISDSDLWEINKDVSKDYIHPTQKPVAVSERAILNSSKPNSIVLDIFGGSGSTLIACEKNNRKCYILELDPLYCDVIIKRWEKFTGKTAVLEK